MTRPPSFDFQIAWADLDPNAHLKNTGYFDYAAQSRMLYFESAGFGPKKFAEHGVGPVVVAETINYRKELRLFERFRVELFCGGANDARSKSIIVNRYLNGEDVLCAELRSTIMWIDLKARKSTTPPPALAEAISALPRTEPFERLG